MTIKQALISILVVLILVAIYLNYKSYNLIEKEKVLSPLQDKYYIVKTICSGTYRGGSNVIVSYKGNNYMVGISNNYCSQVEKGERVTFLYDKENDEILIKGQNFYKAIVYIVYIFCIIALFGFIVYRKELDNHYSTM